MIGSNLFIRMGVRDVHVGKVFDGEERRGRTNIDMQFYDEVMRGKGGGGGWCGRWLVVVGFGQSGFFLFFGGGGEEEETPLAGHAWVMGWLYD